MIDIVIAIYKPTNLLVEQISSLLTQTADNKVARIVLVDDCPDDVNEQLVRQCLQMDSRIEYHVNNSGEHGPSANFFFGLSKTSSDYLMTCDQDDVWFTDKIEVTLKAMQDLDDDNDQPALIATNVTVTDAKLNVIADSFFDYLNCSNPVFKQPHHLMVKNIVNGCTMMFNRALYRQACKGHSQAIMHDWWLLAVAICKGKYHILEQPTMFYRQHGSNCLGAPKNTLLKQLPQLGVWQILQKYHRHINDVVAQTNAVYQSVGVSTLQPYGTSVTTDCLTQLLNECAAFNNKSVLSKLHFIRRFRRDSLKAAISFVVVDLIYSLKKKHKNNKLGCHDPS